MKKLMAILVAVMMLLSLAACGLNGETQGGNESGGESQVENQDSGGSSEESDAPKVEQSRTLDLYKEYFSGPYTLKVETYLKDIRNPDTKTVSSTTLTIVDGSKVYTELVNSTSPDSVVSSLTMDGYNYSIYDEYKTIVRAPVRSNSGGTVMAMQEEEFYIDMLGEVEKREIYGEEYECEVFSALGEKVTYCYKGNELKYIIGDSGGVDIIMGVLELKKGADSSYFELPEDYEKNY